MSHAKVHIWTQRARAQGAGGSRNGSSAFLLSEVSLHKHLPQSAPKGNETPRGPAGTLPLFHGHSHLKSDFVCPRRDSRSLYRGSVPLSSSLKPPSHPCVSGLVFVFVFFCVGRERERQGKCPDCWLFFAAATEFWLSID